MFYLGIHLSILFILGRILHNQFKHNYIKTKTHFLHSLSCSRNWVVNCLSNSYVWLSRRWLSMTSYLFIIGGTSHNQFRSKNCFRKSTYVFKHLKKWPSEIEYFRIYWLGRKSLLKCLKGPVSEHRPQISVFTGAIHQWNLNEKTFAVFLFQLFLDKFTRKIYLLVRSEMY